MVMSELAQSWGIKTGTDLYQPWSDAQQPKTTLNQPWSNAAQRRSQLSQRWASMLMLQNTFNQPWAVLEALSNSLNQLLSVTSSVVSANLQQRHDIKSIMSLSAVMQQQYWLTGNTSVKTLPVQYLLVGEDTVYPVSVNLKTSIDQYAITASIELATKNEREKFIVGSYVSLYGVLNTVFTFIVDTYDYDLSATGDSFSIELISPTALLDSPYSELVTGDYTGMASGICSSLAGDISLVWNTVDWFIGTDTLSASEESPLSVIRKVAAAVGAKLQSTPSGSLVVVPRYPVSVNLWKKTTPTYAIDYAKEVVSEQYSYEQAPGYNSFSIQNEEASDSTLRFTIEEITSTSRSIKVFVYPDATPTVTHSGNPMTVSLIYSGAVVDVVTDTVEFVSGEGSVDGPIVSIGASSWKYSDLGTITYEPTGTLYSNLGDSLLDLTYTTKYYMYSLTTSVAEDIQIIIEADN